MATRGGGAPGARGRGQRLGPARGVGGGAGEHDLGRARARLAQRRRDVPELRRTAALGRPARFECPACGFAQPESSNRLDGDALVLDGGASRSQLALPGRWNLANAALAVTAAVTHFEVEADGRGRARPATVDDRRGAVHGRAARRRPHRARAAREEPGRLDRGAALPLRPDPAAVVIAVNARVADGKDPSWLWDVPYELLRGPRDRGRG